MRKPENYRDACRAFVRGEVDFEQLVDIVRHLPPPDPVRRPTTIAEVYELADDPYPPNSVLWFTLLKDRVGLDDEHVKVLAQAAVKR